MFWSPLFLCASLPRPRRAAELSERTLKTDNVSVKGKFEDIAVLTAYQVFDSEAIVSELINRNQIRNKKQIIAIYNVTVTGEQEPFPVYTISIEGVKLNPLAKTKWRSSIPRAPIIR